MKTLNEKVQGMVSQLHKKIAHAFFRTIEYSFYPHFRVIIGLSLFVTYLYYLESPSFFLTSHELKDLSFSTQVLMGGAVWFLILLSFLAISLGLYTQSAALIAIFCHMYLRNFSQFSTWGWNKVLYYLLFILVVLPCVDSWSLDHKWRKRPLSISLPAFYKKYIEILISLQYFAISAYRFGDTEWAQGLVLRKLLESRIYSRFSFIDWASYDWILVPLNHIGFAVELFGSLIFVLPAGPKKFLIYSLIFLHAALHLTGHLGPWQLIMIAALIFCLPENSLSQEKKNFSFKQKSALWFFFTLVVLLFISAFPLKITPELMRPSSIMVKEFIRSIGLWHVPSQMQMHTSPPLGSCIYIYEWSDQGKIKPVYQNDFESCLSGRLRISNDGVYQAILRRALDRNYDKFALELTPVGKRSEYFAEKSLQFRQEIGFASCHITGERSINKIAVMLFLYRKENLASDIRVLRPISFEYDCQKATPIQDSKAHDQMNEIPRQMQIYWRENSF